jgi:hypothetical protein
VGDRVHEQNQLLVGRAQVAAGDKRHGRATRPPGRGGQRDRPVEVGPHQGQPVGGPQKQGAQSKVRPDQAQDDEERPVHHPFQVTGKAHAGEGKGLHQPARGEPLWISP